MELPVFQNLFEISLLLILSFVIIFWFLSDQRKYERFPPGPLRFPIVGNLFQIYLTSPFTSPPKALCKLSKLWGNVMFVKIGRIETVVFSSHETAVKILGHEKAEDRVVEGAIRDRLMFKNLGVNFSNGDTWKTLRKFTIRTLRDFGFGKSSLDPVINDEVDKLISYWNQRNVEDTTVLFENMFDMTVLNVMWRLITGERFDLDDPKMTRLLGLLADFNKSTNLCVDLNVAFPFFRNWLPATITGKLEQVNCCKSLHEFCRETLDSHRKAGTYMSSASNFVDLFANQIYIKNPDYQVSHKAWQSDPHFNDDQFVLTLIDLLENGVDTISAALTFAILYSVVHPHTQDNVQKEIDSVLLESGCGYISWDMMHRMPYTNAYILETLRFSSLLPVVAPRMAMDDFVFEGYLIKKGTSLLVNLQALNTSESVWIDPDVFRPSRFLDKSGALDNSKAQLVMAFGSGRRVCPAQGFGEQVLFIYFTALLNTYKFIPGENKPFPTISPGSGMTNIPNSFYVKVIRRNICREN